MNFTENSPVVLAWVRQIQIGAQTIDNVPSLGNLKEMVTIVLNK